MMSDQAFLEFSEQLDREPAQGQCPDSQLLLELREVLRDGEVPALESDFARTTARVVQARVGGLPLAERFQVVGRKAFWAGETRNWSGLLLLSGLLAGWLSPLLLGIYGSALLALGLRMRGHVPPVSLFYLVPVLACLATGAVAALGLSALEKFSLSFRADLAVPVLGLSLAGLLLLAMKPSWKLLSKVSGASLGISWVFQIFHGIWLAGALVALRELAVNMGSFAKPAEISPEILVACCLGLATLAAVTHRGPSVSPLALHSLRSTLGGSALSLTMSMGAIGLALSGFYQASLTREIDTRAYQAQVERCQQWFGLQKAIPAELNGWTELRPYFIRPEQRKPENQAILAQFKLGGKVYEGNLKAKDGFLAVVPRVESALNKPHFTHFATEEVGFHGLAPDFLAYRSVAQGLTALAREADDPQVALSYISLNLRWANKSESGTLIELMIELAQRSLALEPIEGWLEKANREQLQRMLALLQTHRLQPQRFAETLGREAYLADLAFLSLMRDGKRYAGDFAPWMQWLPTSYWESERKAYFNLHSERMISVSEMSRISDPNLEERLPFSLGARILVPNVSKAQLRFREIHSKEAQLVLKTALEIYRRDHGVYPERLEELRMKELPIDMLDPRRLGHKGGFDYRRKGAGYELRGHSAEALEKKPARG